MIRARWRERPTPKVQDPDPSWRLRAACRNKPTALWFPEHPGGALPADSQYRRDVMAALRVCNDECNVRGSCLQFALTTRQDQGIWGGRTEREREHLLKRGRVS